MAENGDTSSPNGVLGYRVSNLEGRVQVIETRIEDKLVSQSRFEDRQTIVSGLFDRQGDRIKNVEEAIKATNQQTVDKNSWMSTRTLTIAVAAIGGAVSIITTILSLVAGVH